MIVPHHAPSREQLLYWLHEGSEMEHHLMRRYLYAAFSLKRADTDWNAAQRSAAERWRCVSVAMEEHFKYLARVTQARLCRCVQSRNKPFCDLSHMAAGFEAEGA